MTTGQPLKVLAVEDSTSDARALAALLRDADARCELTHVRTLEAAERALAGAAFQIVLLDLGLPDGDGIENVERMGLAAPGAAIVVLTGRDDGAAALQALRSGAQEYLIKGAYDSDQLLRAMHHAIERHRLMAELSNEREREYYRASHDVLTGLPNRQLFMDRARVALSKAARAGEHFAVCFIDLDGFKPVNDRHGHATGDALLREVAHVLREGLRETDTVARVGGDEFMVLLSPMTLAPGDQEAEAVLQRMVRRVAAISRVGDREISIGASIGVALYPAHGSSLELLIQRADESMYRSKRAGRGRVQLWAGAEARASFGQFRLQYLPWVDWQGTVAGYEALAPAPQAAGLPCREVLARALQDWPPATGAGLRLALPAVAAELQAPDAAQALLGELAARQWPPQRLRLGVAAADLAAAGERSLGALQALRAAGAQIALTHCTAEDLDLGRVAAWPADVLVLDPSWPPKLAAGDARMAALVTGLQAFLGALGRELQFSGVDHSTWPLLRQQFGAIAVQGAALMAPVAAAQLAHQDVA